MKISGRKRVRQSYIQYELTQAKENSDYGIDGGRITKLILKDPENNILCKYDNAMFNQMTDLTKGAVRNARMHQEFCTRIRLCHHLWHSVNSQLIFTL